MLLLHWAQVPGPDLCARAGRLKGLIIWPDATFECRKPTSAEGAAALEGLGALPALQTLWVDKESVCWGGPGEAARILAPLCLRKPGLHVDFDPGSEPSFRWLASVFLLTER